MIAEGFSPQKSGKPACTDADIKAFGLYFHLIQKGRNAFPLEKHRPVFQRWIFPAAIHFFTTKFTHLLWGNRQLAAPSTIPLFKRDFPNKKKSVKSAPLRRLSLLSRFLTPPITTTIIFLFFLL